MNAEYRKQSPSARGIRRGVLLLCALALLGICFAASVRWRGAERIPTNMPTPARRVAPVREAAPKAAPKSPFTSSQSPTVPSLVPTVQRTVPQELVTRLADPNFFSGGVSAEKAEQLKLSLRQLAEQGVAAVPAIREYLDRLQDIDFASVGAAELTGDPTLRISLLDVLRQIGGPEAVELSLQTLRTTGDFQEIAYLTKELAEQIPPEELQAAALTAATEALALAAKGQLGGRNVSPLFEVLQQYGDESVIGVLEKAADKWTYYATLALAGLPDGGGIPALIRLAQDPAITGVGYGDFALRPLAQAADHYPEAGAALVQQARLNRIPDRAWPPVAASLAGDYIHYGNQIFGSTVPPVDWSQDQIHQRVALIDQMLAATSSDAGRQALANARAIVLNKAGK